MLRQSANGTDSQATNLQEKALNYFTAVAPLNYYDVKHQLLDQLGIDMRLLGFLQTSAEAERRSHFLRCCIWPSLFNLVYLLIDKQLSAAGDSFWGSESNTGANWLQKEQIDKVSQCHSVIMQGRKAYIHKEAQKGSFQGNRGSER